MMVAGSSPIQTSGFLGVDGKMSRAPKWYVCLKHGTRLVEHFKKHWIILAFAHPVHVARGAYGESQNAPRLTNWAKAAQTQVKEQAR